MVRGGHDFGRGGGPGYDREMRGGAGGYDAGFRASQGRGYDAGMRGGGPVDGYFSDGRRHRDDRGRRAADWMHEGGTMPGGGGFYANRSFSLRDSGYASGTFFGGGYTPGGEVRGGYDRDFERGVDQGRGRDRGFGRGGR